MSVRGCACSASSYPTIKRSGISISDTSENNRTYDADAVDTLEVSGWRGLLDDEVLKTFTTALLHSLEAELEVHWELHTCHQLPPG